MKTGLSIGVSAIGLFLLFGMGGLRRIARSFWRLSPMTQKDIILLSLLVLDLLALLGLLWMKGKP